MKVLLCSLEAFQRGEVPNEVQKFLKKYPEPFIILDESSKIKTNEPCATNKKSNRTRAISTLNKYGHRCILTGTFISKSPVNAYDQMNFLKPRYFPENMYAFASRYVVRERLPIGRGIVTTISQKTWDRVIRYITTAKKNGLHPSVIFDHLYRNHGLGRSDVIHIWENRDDYTPFKNIGSLFKRIEDDTMIVKRRDVFDIEPKTYIRRNASLTPEMKKFYNKMLREKSTDEFVIEDTLSMFHRLQDVCNGYIPRLSDPDDMESDIVLEKQKTNSKIIALYETLEEIDLNEQQVAIFCNRKVFLQDVVEFLKSKEITTAAYDGDTSTEERNQIAEDFSSGKLRTIVLNQKSGAFGLDFLKDAYYSIFISNDYAVETREQAENRIDRGVYDGAKTIIDIVVEGSIEDKVQKALLIGKELIGAGKSDCSLFELDKDV